MVVIYIIIGLIGVVGLLVLKKPAQLKSDKQRVNDKIARMKPTRLSPHDSSDWAIDQFRQGFGKKYVSVKVGKRLRFKHGHAMLLPRDL